MSELIDMTGKYLLPESAGMNVAIHRKANECKADFEANFSRNHHFPETWKTTDTLSVPPLRPPHIRLR